MGNLTDIRKISEQELKAALAANDEPSFRVKQIQEWMWKKSVVSFDEMTN